jgi:hypothetical protein
MEELLFSQIPIVEDTGKKYLGGVNHIFRLVSTLDNRNQPKKDAKGKLVKPKILMPPLYPKDTKDQEDVDQILNWYTNAMRPTMRHLVRYVLETIRFEKRTSSDKSP